MVTSAALDQLFSVDSVAVIGASEEDGRIGSGLCKSLKQSFKGPVYYINPKYTVLWGEPCYSSVGELSCSPSHAVIAVARTLVPGCLRECADKGIKNVVVISAGFKETDALGAALEQEQERIALERNVTVLGPNCLGFINTELQYNGTFLPADFQKGSISVISQSGGVGLALLDALYDQHCGVAKWAGIGNEAVIDAVALLEYFAADPATKAIGVCFEGLRDLHTFLLRAGEINRRKPVVLLRDGKSAIGRTAAASHTGTMAQSDELMRDLIAQTGLNEARNCRECAAMLKALSLSEPPEGSRVIVLTNTAGPAILAADALDGSGVTLPVPSPALSAKADQAVGVVMGLKNPADISSTGLSPRNYGIASETLLGSEEYDIQLGFFSLSTHLILPDRELTAAALQVKKPAVACFLGRKEVFDRYDRKPEESGIPCYYDPDDAAAAVKALCTRGRAIRSKKTPAPSVMTAEQAEAVKAYVDSLPDGLQSERCAKQLLALAGAPVTVPVPVNTEEELIRAGRRIGGPAVLKVCSGTISHKSDAGGVRLNLNGEETLLEAFREMLPAMRALDPNAQLTLQPMEAEGFELILGAISPETGVPAVMAGRGGIYSEIEKDVSFRMLPLKEEDPPLLLKQLRCYPILEGRRGRPLDRASVERELLRLCEIITLCPRVAELDVNPLRVYETGAALLDARAVLKTK